MKDRKLPGIKKKRKLRLNLMLDQEVIEELDHKDNMSAFVNKILREEFNLNGDKQT